MSDGPYRRAEDIADAARSAPDADAMTRVAHAISELPLMDVERAE